MSTGLINYHPWFPLDFPSMSFATAPPAAAINTATSVHFSRSPPLIPMIPSSHSLLQADQAVSLIEGCRAPRHLLEIHAAVLRAGLERDRILRFKLLRSYAALGRLDRGLALFRLAPDPNVFLWTAIIHAHAAHGLLDLALLLFSEMLSSSVEPNAFTFSSTLGACSLGPGRALHSLALKLRLGADAEPYVGSALLDMYARGGDVTSARNVFHVMPRKTLVSVTAMMDCYAKVGQLHNARQLFDEVDERDHVCWNTMIDGYAQHGKPNEALTLFREMLRSTAKPNEFTVVSVLSACAQLGALESGKWVHSYIENNRIQCNAQVGTALIDMYCKSGSLEDACLVFDKIHAKDVITWNSMIAGYAMHGQSHEAFRLFSRLCAVGLEPTDITFVALLNACSHAGLVQNGREIFRSMEEDYGIEPKIEHYGCMVDLLGRAGFIEEACKLVESMRFEPDPVLWGSLLAACQLHKNTALGEKIGTFLVNNGLANRGTYVLLSNIYAAVGNWKEVARVRTLMKNSAVPREPGCSSIEVNNKVYEFIVGDLSHPRSKEIYSMLEEIGKLLKAHGYVPQTDVVLHDIEESDKERAVGIHSEKLAIAFGLISTQSGTTIKIMKNLRVCTDCHTVTKLLSKIMGRNIIVRDRNRFHHFVGGSCSCGDYW